MATEIWPNGDIQPSVGRVDGQTYVRLELTDGESGEQVRIGWNLAAFVAVADHLKMVADALVAEASGQG